MTERRLTALVLCAMLCALRASAAAQQPKKIFRVGYFSVTDAASDAARSGVIRQALRELGYIEGQNIVFEYRYGMGQTRRYSELATELVRRKVDVLVIAGITDSYRRVALYIDKILKGAKPADLPSSSRRNSSW